MSEDIRNLPGMKERELRELATCFICRKRIGEAHPLGIFYKLTVERFMIDVAALRRQAGLEAMMNGSVAIAQALGPDEDLAKQIMKPTTISICETCALEPSGDGFRTRIPYLFGAIVEHAGERDREATS